jgi:nitroreductase
VERPLIEQLIDAGRMAPSAMNRQPWSFYILTDAEQISLLSKEIGRAAMLRTAKSGIKSMVKSAADLYHAYRSMDYKWGEDMVFHGAPVVIFLTAPKENEWAPTDIGMCAQNMLLAACSLGLAACPVGFATMVESAKDYGMLRIPANEHVLLSVVVGYGDEHPEVHPRRKNNVFFLNDAKPTGL